MGASQLTPGAISAAQLNLSPALLTTLTNPTPAIDGRFGQALAALGSDRIVAAVERDGTGAAQAGIVHVFSMDGTLLATIRKPNPGAGDVFGGDFFGSVLLALGTDRATARVSGQQPSGSPH